MLRHIALATAMLTVPAPALADWVHIPSDRPCAKATRGGRCHA